MECHPPAAPFVIVISINHLHLSVVETTLTCYLSITFVPFSIYSPSNFLLEEGLARDVHAYVHISVSRSGWICIKIIVS